MERVNVLKRVEYLFYSRWSRKCAKENNETSLKGSSFGINCIYDIFMRVEGRYQFSLGRFLMDYTIAVVHSSLSKELYVDASGNDQALGKGSEFCMLHKFVPYEVAC
jgi:hypothetical protein